jgi:ADP-ribosylglycohydrolase
MEAAEGLAAGDRPATACLASLGQGWVAEEALALSLFCALRATSLEEGVILAVNLTGDSDSTGAITGNLLGALRGAHELPDRWLAQLELRTVLEAMADDLATVDRWALAEQPTPLQKQEQAYWVERYPGS